MKEHEECCSSPFFLPFVTCSSFKITSFKINSFKITYFQLWQPLPFLWCLFLLSLSHKELPKATGVGGGLEMRGNVCSG